MFYIADVKIERLRFHYDNENENEFFVYWRHYFLCSSWVPIRYRCSRRWNGSDESFIVNEIFSILKMTENNSGNTLKVD